MDFVKNNKRVISYLVFTAFVLSIFLGFSAVFFNVFNQNELVYKTNSNDNGMVGAKNSNSFSGLYSINNYVISLLGNFESNSSSNAFHFSVDKNTKYVFNGFFNINSLGLYLLFTLLCIMLCKMQIEKQRKALFEGDGRK